MTAMKDRKKAGADGNVDSGPGSKKGSSGHEELKGTSSVDRHEKTHDVEFAKGGDTHMFGEQEANDAKSGTVGKPDVAGPGAKFAEGGKGKMFSFAPSVPARDGITGAR